MIPLASVAGILALAALIIGSRSDGSDEARSSPSAESTPLVGDPDNQAPRAQYPAPDLNHARYALALAARNAGDQHTATQIFTAVVQENGPLAPLASLRLAQTLAAQRLQGEAATAYVAASQDTRLPGDLGDVARLEGADVLDSLGRPAEALALLEAVEGNAAARWARDGDSPKHR